MIRSPQHRRPSRGVFARPWMDETKKVVGACGEGQGQSAWLRSCLGVSLLMLLSSTLGACTQSDGARSGAELDLDHHVRAATVQLVTAIPRVAVGGSPGADGTAAVPLRGWAAVIDAEAGYIVGNHHVIGMVDTMEVQGADGRHLGLARRLGSSECHDLAVARFEPDGTLDPATGGAVELTSELDWYVDLIRPELSLLPTEVLRPSSQRAASAASAWDGALSISSLGAHSLPAGEVAVDESTLVVRSPPERTGSSLVWLSQGMTVAAPNAPIATSLEVGVRRSSGPMISAVDHSIVGIAYATAVDDVNAATGGALSSPVQTRQTLTVAATEASLVAQRLIAGELALGMGIVPRIWFHADRGTPGPKGVWVEAVRPGSPAAELGLRPGDLITRIGDQVLDDASDLLNYSLRGYCDALERHRIGPSREPVMLTIIRDPLAGLDERRNKDTTVAHRATESGRRRCVGRLHATPLALLPEDVTRAQALGDRQPCS